MIRHCSSFLKVVGLTRLVGASRAADLILTARKVSAREAFTLGLANRISEPGKAPEEALSLALSISENGPRAVRHAHSVIRRVADLTAGEEEASDIQSAVSSTLQVQDGLFVLTDKPSVYGMW